MAITKLHPISSTLGKALDYISNPEKTDEGILVSGYACTTETAYQEFEITRENSMKNNGYLAFHLIQSFAPGEVDFETAHKIGIELADKVFKGDFEYICATHIDKGHYHNHIISNSVSFKTNKKYHSTHSNIYYIRRQSDMICKEYGLSVIEEPKERGKSHYERTLEKKGQSWKSLLRQTIDKAILQAKNWDEFLLIMQREKYEVKPGKYISFRAEGQERFTRSKTIGIDYTEENIRNRIAGGGRQISNSNANFKGNILIDIENSMKAQQSNGYANWAKKINLKVVAQTMNYLTENNLLSIESMDEKIAGMSDRYNGSRDRIKIIEKRIKLLEEQIHEIDVYRKTKHVVDGINNVVCKEKYRHEHESEFILFNTADKEIKKWFGKEKPPFIKSMRAEQNRLIEEKAKILDDIYNEKPELDELKNMRKNVSMFLGINKDQRQEPYSHKTSEIE